MQEGKVKIADGKPKTRAKLNHFLSEIKLRDPYTKIKTLGDAVEFAIEQAERVPILEKRIEELEKKIEALEGE